MVLIPDTLQPPTAAFRTGARVGKEVFAPAEWKIENVAHNKVLGHIETQVRPLSAQVGVILDRSLSMAFHLRIGRFGITQKLRPAIVSQDRSAALESLGHRHLRGIVIRVADVRSGRQDCLVHRVRTARLTRRANRRGVGNLVDIERTRDRHMLATRAQVCQLDHRA